MDGYTFYLVSRVVVVGGEYAKFVRGLCVCYLADRSKRRPMPQLIQALIQMKISSPRNYADLNFSNSPPDNVFQEYSQEMMEAVSQDGPIGISGIWTDELEENLMIHIEKSQS